MYLWPLLFQPSATFRKQQRKGLGWEIGGGEGIYLSQVRGAKEVDWGSCKEQSEQGTVTKELPALRWAETVLIQKFSLLSV